jgi:hypothetical protein
VVISNNDREYRHSFEISKNAWWMRLQDLDAIPEITQKEGGEVSPQTHLIGDFLWIVYRNE